MTTGRENNMTVFQSRSSHVVVPQLWSAKKTDEKCSIALDMGLIQQLNKGCDST
jgi:hypothetical protein